MSRAEIVRFLSAGLIRSHACISEPYSRTVVELNDERMLRCYERCSFAAPFKFYRALVTLLRLAVSLSNFPILHQLVHRSRRPDAAPSCTPLSPSPPPFHRPHSPLVMSRTTTSSASYTLRASGGTWTCTECSYVNQSRENECGNCPAPRPDPYAFCNIASSSRPKKTSHVVPSTTPGPRPRRVLRSSGAALAPPPPAAHCRTSKRKACSGTSSVSSKTPPVQPTKVAEEEAEDSEDEMSVSEIDSDDESQQQRYTQRPKRHCAEQTQQRLNTYYRTTKSDPHATAMPLKYQPPPLPPATPPPAPTNRTLKQHKPLPEPAKPERIEQSSPTVVVAVPTAFVAPPLAASPFVPSTRGDTIALLNQVHAALALSAYPTTTTALLPSRTLQLTHVATFLTQHLTARTPAALYIAGRPGVGKTLTVDWALQSVLGAGVAVLGSGGGMAGGGATGKVWRCGGGGKMRGRASTALPATTVVTVNTIALMKGHGSFWCKLLALLTSSGSNSSRQHDDLLQLPADEALRRVQQLIDNTRKRGEMIVLAVDEIDALLSSAASSAASGSSTGGGGSFMLLHALFRLVYSASSCVVLVSISNNITLLDSHCSALSATNSLPERVVFSTYSQDDLLCILQERLLRCLADSSAPSSQPTSSSEASSSLIALPFFAPAALEFICKATSKDTGDIRRCLRDCRQAIQQLLTITATTATTTAPFTAAQYHLTVSSLARVKAEREAATQHGRLTDLSVQQLHVLWVVALVGGVTVTAGVGGGEVYRRCCVRVRGCGLTELSGGEVVAVLEMLESEGMVRKDKQGRLVRYVSVVSVERMRRQLRGDIWDALWSKAELIQAKA